MFLINPKPKPSVQYGSKPLHNQPAAKITKVTRVQTACDRCRIKKVKCDGDRPCLRCSQDEAPCIASKKTAPSDSKGLLRDYVQSMESQQARLIKALQKVRRDVQQSIKVEDMSEIVQIVRACGFDFEDVPESWDGQMQKETTKPKHIEVGDEGVVTATCLARQTDKNDAENKDRSPTFNDDGGGCPRKRKSEELDDQGDSDIAQESETREVDGTGSIVFVPNGGFDGEPQLSSTKKRKSSSSSQLTDDYWNLDHYWDQLLGAYSPSEQAAQSFAPLSGQSFQPSPRCTFDSTSQRPPPEPPWEPDSSLLPLDFSEQVSDLLINSGPQEAYLAAEPTESSLSTFWPDINNDFTLWWDPSLVFNTDIENPGLGFLPSQPSGLSHGLSDLDP